MKYLFSHEPPPYSTFLHHFSKRISQLHFFNDCVFPRNNSNFQKTKFPCKMFRVLLTFLVLSLSISVTIEENAQILYSDCGTNSTLLHFTDYKSTDLVRNKVLSFWSGDAYLSENVTSGIVDFWFYKDNVPICYAK